MMRSFIFEKFSIAQTTLTCSVITLVLRSSQRSGPTGGQCKACSDILLCTRSSTSGNRLVFLTFTLVQEILLHAAVNNCSSFQIQLGISHFHPQALSSAFRNSHWKSTSFHALQYGWIPLDYKPSLPLDPYLKINLKANFEGIFLPSKAAQTTRNSKLS